MLEILRMKRMGKGNFKKISFEGFPGGSVVESLPADAGDADSCPGPGRSHMPRRRLGP